LIYNGLDCSWYDGMTSKEQQGYRTSIEPCVATASLTIRPDCRGKKQCGIADRETLRKKRKTKRNRNRNRSVRQKSENGNGDIPLSPSI
jgi:hypothetical protein